MRQRLSHGACFGLVDENIPFLSNHANFNGNPTLGSLGATAACVIPTTLLLPWYFPSRRRRKIWENLLTRQGWRDALGALSGGNVDDSSPLGPALLPSPFAAPSLCLAPPRHLTVHSSGRPASLAGHAGALCTPANEDACIRMGMRYAMRAAWCRPQRLCAKLGAA